MLATLDTKEVRLPTAPHRQLIRSTLNLKQDLSGVAKARKFVASLLALRSTSRTLYIAELLVSELVTNAILHGKSSPTMRIVTSMDSIRVEVEDSSDDLPVVKDLVSHEAGGRGMALVAELSSDWGIEAVNDGKVIWFELEL